MGLCTPQTVDPHVSCLQKRHVAREEKVWSLGFAVHLTCLEDAEIVFFVVRGKRVPSLQVKLQRLLLMFSVSKP